MDYMSVLSTALTSLGYTNQVLRKKPKVETEYDTLPVVEIAPLNTTWKRHTAGHIEYELNYQILYIDKNDLNYSTSDGGKTFITAIINNLSTYNDSAVWRTEFVDGGYDFDRAALGDNYDCIPVRIKFYFTQQA